jgi:hypothetical protein
MLYITTSKLQQLPSNENFFKVYPVLRANLGLLSFSFISPCFTAELPWLSSDENIFNVCPVWEANPDLLFDYFVANARFSSLKLLIYELVYLP